jgi:hypothetical protein
MTESEFITVNLTIPPTVQARIDEWYETHECENKRRWLKMLKMNPGALRGGCVGGDTTYEITFTTIGTTVNLRCACGARLEDVDRSMENP